MMKLYTHFARWMVQAILFMPLLGCDGGNSDLDQDSYSGKGISLTLNGFDSVNRPPFNTINDTSGGAYFETFEANPNLESRPSSFGWSAKNEFYSVHMDNYTDSKYILDSYDLSGFRIYQCRNTTCASISGSWIAIGGTFTITSRANNSITASINDAVLDDGETVSGQLQANLTYHCWVGTKRPDLFENSMQSSNPNWAWGLDTHLQTNFCKGVAGLPVEPDPVACSPTQADLVAGTLGDFAMVSRSSNNLTPNTYYLVIDLAQLGEIEKTLSENPNDSALALAASVVPALYSANQGSYDNCNTAETLALRFDYSGKTPPDFVAINANLASLQTQMDSLASVLGDIKKQAIEFIFKDIMCPVSQQIFSTAFGVIGTTLAQALIGCY